MFHIYTKQIISVALGRWKPRLAAQTSCVLVKVQASEKICLKKIKVAGT